MKVLCINARCVEKHLELNKVYIVVCTLVEKGIKYYRIDGLKMITLVQKDLKLLMKKKSKSKFNKEEIVNV